MPLNAKISMETDYIRSVTDCDEHEFFFRSIHLNEMDLLYCGYQKCRPGHKYGPTMRDHFYFHFITSGRGIFCNDHTYSVEAGSGFVGLPYQIAYYEADQADPWTYMWIGAKGQVVTSLLNQIVDLGQMPIITPQDTGELYRIMNSFIFCAQDPSFSSYLEAASLFYALFSILYQSVDRAPGTQKLNRDLKTKDYLDKAREFIQNNYFKHISMLTVANYVGIDPDYLARIFKKEFDVTPVIFLRNLRLGLAHKLLLHTSMPVQEIAVAVGFTDPQYFSRCFTKSRGVSPRELRKNTSL